MGRASWHGASNPKHIMTADGDTSGVTCGPSVARHVGVAPAIVNNNPTTMKLPRRSFRTLVGCVLSGAQVEQIATPLSLPGLTRQSIHLRKNFSRRRWMRGVISAFTRVFDALLPAHDGWRHLRAFAAARAGWSDPCIFLFFCRFGIFHPRSHDLKHAHLLVPAARFRARGLHLCFTHPESRGGRSAEKRSGAAAPVGRAILRQRRA
jgi:hypothetical protein